ncbi:MAG: glutamate synthase large subunit [Candidatus Margulisbacteria bacterium]|nr:glutamate synthase large subunit [Candidatus Margulisiibacteriota bacterium]
MSIHNYPHQQGLYDPAFEHDSCGVGFVVDIAGRASNSIVKQGLQVLERLAHRGAVGADPFTGDGAGILIQTPHEFYLSICAEQSIKLPPAGAYGTGLVFISQNKRLRGICEDVISKIVAEEGQNFLGWRKLPTDDNVIGQSARDNQPIIEQIFIAKGKQVNNQIDFERKLYNIRRKIEKEIPSSGLYIVSLSSRTIVYKGLLMPHQVEKYFLDLQSPLIKSAIALVHSRYSTNTFPTWDLAQPFRFLAHNGEINTLRGNINWMRARGINAIVPGGSDSAALDNVFELLVLSGRSLAEVMMLLIPAAWEHNPQIDKKLKDFYKFNACFMEPWDGPAAVAFTDGRNVGAVLDRNGLRPARYIVTKDGLVVMSSEVGVLDIEPDNIKVSGRLEPGKMFYIDTEKKRIIRDEEITEDISSKKPYGKWLKENLVHLEDLLAVSSTEKETLDINTLLRAYGYTREDLKTIIKPMAEKGKEPVGSMGNDTPHAILSPKPQLFYSYFKQLFAQVTNPPIDPIREELVMSLQSYLGPQKDIFKESAEHCRRLLVKQPILSNDELGKIRHIQKNNFRSRTVYLLFVGDMQKAIENVCQQVEQAINEGIAFVILSDRGISKQQYAVPALLAIGAVHHFLIRKAKRTQVGLILESAEPREVHHFALLVGYGADLINPYLAYEAVALLVEQKELCLDARTAINNYRLALNHGILKILSKMGISTLSSYRGAQIFEALGLSPDLVNRYFEGTPSRIGGADLAVIEAETKLRQQAAFNDPSPLLESGGLYQWKKDGAFHLWNPASISALQDAVRRNDAKRYKEFSNLINDQAGNPTTLRSLLKFKGVDPIPLEEVEPIESVLKRFATGAMSYGSISGPAHETIAIAMNRIGGKSNTGEGGENAARFVPMPNGDSKRSAIKQVASGRFGVNTNYLVNADELQIKIAQGAKPGEGGQLPGHKVSEIIAKTRFTTPGVMLISPPPHHDIYSIEDLAQLIFDLKNVNPRARISVKLVSEIGVGTVAAGVAKGHADMILISGGDGGTGASPVSSIRHAGLPWELGLSETHQTLVLNDLRGRVRLQTDGQLRTGRDAAIAALLGAEEFGFCTAILIACGCVMLRHCHLNNCSVGVATQDEYLSRRFAGQPEHIINYLTFVAGELREIMAQLGCRKLDEMVGRTDLLEVDKMILPWKAKGIDYSKILFKPQMPPQVKTRCSMAQDHGIDMVLDRKLIDIFASALDKGEKTSTCIAIKNNHRTAGAMLSGEVCQRYGVNGLPDDTIRVKFHGTAGQSFGAWLARGVTFELEGLSNDYVGKGISGGKIIICPDQKADYRSEENIIIGNTAFYGAIAGEAYIRGVAGERFCIRNSGLTAVVEGVGDHGCEYMTGGRVVVLGKTGRNFAAGMSGGIAYVYDKRKELTEKCNTEMVELEEMTMEDEKLVLEMIGKHWQNTQSVIAKHIYENFRVERRRFVKVMPKEYKRVLEERAISEAEKEEVEV